MIYYPIVIPTLCRFSHLKKCIESLAECTGAQETELYVSVDYPPSDKYKEGYNEIMSYLPSVTGFKKIIVFEQKKNLGAVKNSQFLISEVSKLYDAYIYTEDDNVFSPNFLVFMNLGLEKYAHDELVSSISGYNYPFYKEIGGVNLRPVATAWGIGRWPQKDEKYCQYWTLDYQKTILSSWKLSMRILFTNPLILSMLITMVNKGIFWGDVSRSIDNIINKRYQLCPSFSLVRNTGHDGSGEHCVTNDYYLSQPIDDRKSFTSDYSYRIPSISEKFRIFQIMMPRKFISSSVVVVQVISKYIKYRFQR